MAVAKATGEKVRGRTRTPQERASPPTTKGFGGTVFSVSVSALGLSCRPATLGHDQVFEPLRTDLYQCYTLKWTGHFMVEHLLRGFELELYPVEEYRAIYCEDCRSLFSSSFSSFSFSSWWWWSWPRPSPSSSSFLLIIPLRKPHPTHLTARLCHPDFRRVPGPRIDLQTARAHLARTIPRQEQGGGRGCRPGPDGCLPAARPASVGGWREERQEGQEEQGRRRRAAGRVREEGHMISRAQTLDAKLCRCRFW